MKRFIRRQKHQHISALKKIDAARYHCVYKEKNECFQSPAALAKQPQKRSHPSFSKQPSTQMSPSHHQNTLCEVENT